MSRTILRVDASMRREGSVSRALADTLIERIAGPEDRMIHRDLAKGITPIDENWITANFTPAEARSEADKVALACSDTLVGELQEADVLVIATPIYNFGVPAVLKAWIDQVARAGLTFRYTAEGPVGLLTGKKAYVLVASGGTPVGSDTDFATPWLRQILGFIGLANVHVISADQLIVRGADSVAAARSAINALAA